MVKGELRFDELAAVKKLIIHAELIQNDAIFTALTSIRFLNVIFQI